MSKTSLILRGSKGLCLLSGEKPFNELKTLSAQNTIRSVDVSNDGQYLCFADNNSVKVVSLPDCELVFEKIGVNVNFVKLSPKGTVLATWHHFTHSSTQNLNLYNVFTQTLLSGMSQKKPSRWCPHWTDDESVCVRHVNMELNFYSNNEFERYVHRFYSQKVANFSMITNRQTGCHYIACYTVGAKGQPSFVRIYRYPHFDGGAMANKSFYKADNVDFKWNFKGDALLLLCSTDVDQTGKSYYGQQSLHYLDINGETCIVSLKKDGPIHNTAWVPHSSMFCVIYGFMPAKTSLFNNKSEVIFEFGEWMRNSISFNRFGNLVSLAGLGNLRAGVQVWHITERKLISEFKAPDTTHIEWCPDGTHILTATTAPRLRVGNGFRIWSHTGVKEHEDIYDSNTELNEIFWRPSNVFTEPKIELQKGSTVKKSTEPPKYVPPHMRTANTKQLSSKPKASDPNAVALTENQKKIRNLEKKLQQINSLKEMMASGKEMEKNQLEKISKESELINDLQELKLKD